VAKPGIMTDCAGLMVLESLRLEQGKPGVV
jgi:hypothetical protein